MGYDQLMQLISICTTVVIVTALGSLYYHHTSIHLHIACACSVCMCAVKNYVATQCIHFIRTYHLCAVKSQFIIPIAIAIVQLSVVSFKFMYIAKFSKRIVMVIYT